MADLRRLHPRLTEADLESTPFVPELSPVTDPRDRGNLMTRPWLDWARRLTLLVGVKKPAGGGESDPTHVVGPDSATPDAVAIYSGSTGKIIKDSFKTIAQIISDAVSQAVAAILPGGILPVSKLPAHKTTHQSGGSDTLDVKLLTGYPGTATTFLNGTGGFTTPAAGVPGAHHLTHEPGGSDPMAVDAVAAVGSLRTLGTGANQAAPGNDARFTAPSVPTAHAATHLGGSDPLQVTGPSLLIGRGNLGSGAGNVHEVTLGTGLAFSGVTLNATGGVIPGAHATSHQPGGADPMAVDAAVAVGSLRTLGTGAQQAAPGDKVARKDLPNTFTEQQTISAATPALNLTETDQPANLRNWVIQAFSQQLQMTSSTDAWALVKTLLSMDRAGNATVGNNLTVTGSGGNVACKDQANTFTQDQHLTKSVPHLTLVDTSQPANSRAFDFGVFSQELLVQALNDAETIASGTMRFTRAGHLRISGAFAEANRTTGLGYWTPIAFNAANFGTVGGGTWSVVAGNVYAAEYMVVGATLWLNLYMLTGVTGGPVALTFYLPSTGYAATGTGAVPFVYDATGVTGGAGMAQVFGGGNYLNFYRHLGATQTWPDGSVLIGCMVPIKIV